MWPTDSNREAELQKNLITSLWNQSWGRRRNTSQRVMVGGGGLLQRWGVYQCSVQTKCRNQFSINGNYTTAFQISLPPTSTPPSPDTKCSLAFPPHSYQWSSLKSVTLMEITSLLFSGITEFCSNLCRWTAPFYQSHLKWNGQRCSFLHELFHLQFTYTSFCFPFHICCLARLSAIWYCLLFLVLSIFNNLLPFRSFSFRRAAWGPQQPCKCVYLFVNSQDSHNFSTRSASSSQLV